MSASQLLHELDARLTPGTWKVIWFGDRFSAEGGAREPGYGIVQMDELGNYETGAMREPTAQALAAYRNTLPLIVAAIAAAEKMRAADIAGMGAWTQGGDAATRAFVRASDELDRALAALASALAKEATDADR